MKIKRKLHKTACVFAAAAMLCCLIVFSGCPAPWYIPKKYSDKKMSQIYSYIKEELLTAPTDYLAAFDYTDPADNSEHSVNIWNSGGKVIMNFDLYSDGGSAVYYDGVYKRWDSATQTETVKLAELGEWQFLFDRVNGYAEYIKTNVVGTDYDDGYCHECFPWGYGMAVIYYKVDGADITASWQVESGNNKPLVSFAEFNSSREKKDGMSLTVYAEPYDIDERIPNILNNYEKQKLQ